MSSQESWTPSVLSYVEDAEFGQHDVTSHYGSSEEASSEESFYQQSEDDNDVIESIDNASEETFSMQSSDLQPENEESSSERSYDGRDENELYVHFHRTFNAIEHSLRDQS